MQFNSCFSDTDFVVLFDADYQNQFAINFLCAILLGRTRARLIAIGNDRDQSLQRLHQRLESSKRELVAMLCKLEVPTRPEAADAALVAVLIEALRCPDLQGIVLVTHDHKLYEMGMRLIEMVGNGRAMAFKIPGTEDKDLGASEDKAQESEANQKAEPSRDAIEAIRKWRVDHPASYGAVPANAIDSLAQKTGIAKQELVRADAWLRTTTPKAN